MGRVSRTSYSHEFSLTRLPREFYKKKREKEEETDDVPEVTTVFSLF